MQDVIIFADAYMVDKIMEKEKIGDDNIKLENTKRKIFEELRLKIENTP